MPASSPNHLQSSNMYYPYGSLQPGRYSQTAVTSRYGFQGQEKDNEIRGEGNSLNYKYRMHDARIGRFFALDPLSPEYPHNSPYAFSENVVINAVELEGLEKYFAADGSYIGTFGTSPTIRIMIDEDIIILAKTMLSGNKLANKAAEIKHKNINDYWKSKSTAAYTIDKDFDLRKNWAKKYVSKSADREWGMIIFQKTFKDEDGSDITLLLPENTVKGPKKVNSEQQMVEISKSEPWIVGRNQFTWAGIRKRNNGWTPFSAIHTHAGGGKLGFSEADWKYSLDKNIPLMMIDFDNPNTLNEFYPSKYKSERDYRSNFTRPIIDKEVAKQSKRSFTL